MKRCMILLFLLIATVLTVKAEGKMYAEAGGVRHLGGERYRLYLSLFKGREVLQGVKKENLKLYGEWDKESEIDFEISFLKDNYVPAHYSFVIDNGGLFSGELFDTHLDLIRLFIESSHKDDIFSFYPIVDEVSPVIEGVDRVSALRLLETIKCVEKYLYGESSLMMARAYNALLQSEDERRKIIILSGNVRGVFSTSSDKRAKLKDGDVMVSSVAIIVTTCDRVMLNSRYSKVTGGWYTVVARDMKNFPEVYRSLKEHLDNYYVVDFKLPINEQVSGEMQINVEKDGLTGSCEVIVNGGRE